VDKVRSIDNASGPAYEVMGRTSWIYEHDFEKAEAFFLRAMELMPGYDVTYGSYAWMKYVTGDFEGAKELQRKAINLNPLNSGYHAVLAEIYLIGGELDSAIIYYDENLRLFPDDIYSTWGLGIAYGFGGEYDKAIDLINNIPGYEDQNFGTAYFAVMNGDTAYAKSILDIHLDLNKQDPNGWKWPTAVIYTALGQDEKAIDLLTETPNDLMYCALWFESLRTNPRFQQLLQNNGFDPSSYPN
ncbi:MAG: hypothetical protein OEQ53_13035, partial [Saprospiraceae bacterium]|nr:hypothetical protein [Saprospiraceae bacterium]